MISLLDMIAEEILFLDAERKRITKLRNDLMLIHIEKHFKLYGKSKTEDKQ